MVSFLQDIFFCKVILKSEIKLLNITQHHTHMRANKHCSQILLYGFSERIDEQEVRHFLWSWHRQLWLMMWDKETGREKEICTHCGAKFSPPNYFSLGMVTFNQPIHNISILHLLLKATIRQFQLLLNYTERVPDLNILIRILQSNIYNCINK